MARPPRDAYQIVREAADAEEEEGATVSTPDSSSTEQMHIETLSQIEVCLRIHWSPLPFECRDIELTRLLDFGLIESNNEDWYRTTEKGKVYVEAVRAVPLPVQKWSMP